LAKGDIAVGLRNADEVMTARPERLIDLFVWIDREVPHDPIQTFGAELCDVIVSNHGSLDECFLKLMTLARFGRLFLQSPLSGVLSTSAVLGHQLLQLS